jgi:hypothetical protein
LLAIGAVPLGWIGRLTRAVVLSLGGLLPLRRVIEAVDTIAHSLVCTSWFATMFLLWLMLIASFHLLTYTAVDLRSGFPLGAKAH